MVSIALTAGKTPYFIQEVTTVAPDIICVEVRDPPIGKGAFQVLSTPDAAAAGTAVQRTNPITGKTDTAFVEGNNKNYLRFNYVRPTVYYPRYAGDVAANWKISGGLTVSSVNRTSVPYSEGPYHNGGGFVNAATLKHLVYLNLSGNLSSGTTYTVTPPVGTGLAPITLAFDDKVTRCSSILSTQVGQRANDDGKIAYLAKWINGYGTEGAIDFATTYSVTGFNIINAAGSVVYSLGTFAQRVTPTTAEIRDASNCGYGNGTLHYYLSTTVAPKQMTSAMTNANPGIFTCTGHGLANGTVIILDGMATASDGSQHGLNKFIGTVANTAANTFTLKDTIGLYGAAGSDLNTTSLGIHVPGVYVPPLGDTAVYDSLICTAILRNRAATYVFGMDYSGWTGAADGWYRLQIPGFGVSDPFYVSDGIWNKVARYAAMGYYHQLAGTALDGRFGYSLGANLKDGVDGLAVYWSNCPQAFTGEDGGYAGVTSVEQGSTAQAPYITANRAPAGIFGGHHDAGDWCSLCYYHAGGIYNLLDSGYEFAPAASGRATNFNFPRSTTTLDATFWAGTDGMSDAFHMAAYWLDFYRRTQDVNGAVASGVSFGVAGFGDGGINPLIPSTAQWFPMVLNAADHAANYAYSWVAIKMAIIARAAGLTTLATALATSGIAAFNWAEGVLTGLASDVHFYYDTTAYHGVALGMAANAGWSLGTLTTAIGTKGTVAANSTGLQQSALFQRVAAAGVLFRWMGITGGSQATYKNIVETEQAAGTGAAQAYWEYYNGLNADVAVKSAIAFDFSNFGVNFCTASEDSTNAYFTAQGLTSQGIGVNTTIFYSYNLGDATLKTRIRKVLQKQALLYNGANQYGYCFTTGLGYRNSLGVLHRDAQAQAVAPPVGITTYTWAPITGGMILVGNYSVDVAANYTAVFPTGQYEADFGSKRLVKPSNFATPIWSFVPENSYCIFHMEFTTHGVILPMYIVALWLWCWDGNAVTG